MSLMASSDYVDDRPDQGIFRVDPGIFTDPSVFELEMKYIFERTWIFMALESQISRPHDFVTNWIGRTPVIITRRADGTLHGMVNACRHKGAQVCQLGQGNAKTHTCPYHGWIYDSSGRNIDIKDKAAGQYPPAFDHEDHDLVAVARVDSYRGLVFASLSEDVPPLVAFLGEFRGLIDLLMDQAPQGMEIIPGRSIHTFRANWKMQMDNGLDFYHLTSTHASYMQILAKRRVQNVGNVDAPAFDWRTVLEQKAGSFGFRHGHSAIWLEQGGGESRAIYPQAAELTDRLGKTRTEWLLRNRQALVFPNLSIVDSVATMLRVIRPVSTDLTEMRLLCMAPIGEPDEIRAVRIRQFEDFFSASGMATPDDTLTFQNCQSALGASGLGWLQGYMRGMAKVGPGANQYANELGVAPEYGVAGPYDMQNEIAYQPMFREWARMIQAGLDGKPAFEPGTEE